MVKRALKVLNGAFAIGFVVTLVLLDEIDGREATKAKR